MDMIKCQKCGNELNIDEQASGKCFSCGATFNSVLAEDKTIESSDSDRDVNLISGMLKMVAVAIFIAGTIGSIAVGGQSYSFSFGAFLIP